MALPTMNYEAWLVEFNQHLFLLQGITSAELSFCEALTLYEAGWTPLEAAMLA